MYAIMYTMISLCNQHIDMVPGALCLVPGAWLDVYLAIVSIVIDMYNTCKAVHVACIDLHVCLLDNSRRSNDVIYINVSS